MDPAIDAEVLSLTAGFFQSVGVAAELRLNSIGCPNCRPGYRRALTEYIAGLAGELCSNCAQRHEANPMRSVTARILAGSRAGRGAQDGRLSR